MRRRPATSAFRCGRTKISLFVLTSMAAALVGVITFTQTSSAVSEQGVGNEFYYIIAAVVGGCLLTGGYGSIVGAAPGRVHSRHGVSRASSTPAGTARGTSRSWA